jgi:hypothetical protein
MRRSRVNGATIAIPEHSIITSRRPQEATGRNRRKRLPRMSSLPASAISPHTRSAVTFSRTPNTKIIISTTGAMPRTRKPTIRTLGTRSRPAKARTAITIPVMMRKAMIASTR